MLNGQERKTEGTSCAETFVIGSTQRRNERGEDGQSEREGGEMGGSQERIYIYISTIRSTKKKHTKHFLLPSYATSLSFFLSIQLGLMTRKCSNQAKKKEEEGCRKKLSRQSRQAETTDRQKGKQINRQNKNVL